MNPYLETLKDELREDCGEDICQADWDCFWDAVREINLESEVFAEVYDDFDEAAKLLAEFAQGTRADLPSIVKYAYAAIEESLE